MLDYYRWKMTDGSEFREKKLLQRIAYCVRAWEIPDWIERFIKHPGGFHGLCLEYYHRRK